MSVLFLKQDPKAKYEALDALAAKAMQGILMGESLLNYKDEDHANVDIDDLAALSYDIAEAMLRERHKRIEKEFGTSAVRKGYV